MTGSPAPGWRRRAAGLDVTDTAPDALAELSPQQQQIIRLASRGLTNREIGEKLFLSPRTVDTHVASLLAKIGARNRVEIAMWAYDTGRVGD